MRECRFDGSRHDVVDLVTSGQYGPGLHHGTVVDHGAAVHHDDDAGAGRGRPGGPQRRSVRRGGMRFHAANAWLERELAIDPMSVPFPDELDFEPGPAVGIELDEEPSDLFGPGTIHISEGVPYALSRFADLARPTRMLRRARSWTTH